jgi:hypothetical protein
MKIAEMEHERMDTDSRHQAMLDGTVMMIIAMVMAI